MMNIHLWSIGKWKSPHCEALVSDYMQRLSHYFEGGVQLFKSETKMLEALTPADYLVACDERGKEFSSRDFAAFIEKRRDTSVRRLVVFIGDATGLTKEVRARANLLWSFSPQTFPHELALVVAAEQLYRAATILRGEKYHYG